MSPGPDGTHHALIVIDVQNDFCPQGALPVPKGDEVIAPINALIKAHHTRVLTQDWHPAGHSSFASSHPGKQPFEQVQMPYGAQVLWPDHCVQGSEGAAFHKGLNTKGAQMILRKGMRPEVDSYSAFFENDHKTPTGLEGFLRAKGITTLTLAGLATDYCVGYSALDGARLGFEVRVALHACRAIDLDGSLEAMMAKMRAASVALIA